MVPVPWKVELKSSMRGCGVGHMIFSFKMLTFHSVCVCVCVCVCLFLLYQSQGTVCDDGWGAMDAQVVCHQLGFFGTANAVRGTQFGFASSDQPIWLDDVACTGSEMYLSDCQSNGYGNHNCYHYEDAGVICEGIIIMYS